MSIKLTHIPAESGIVWAMFYTRLLAAELHSGLDNPNMALGSVNRIGYMYGVEHNKPFWLHHVVAELDGQYIGIGTIHVLETGAHLMSLYVRPEHRHRGLGTRLLRTLRVIYPEIHGVSTALSARLYDKHDVPLVCGDSYLPATLTKGERRAINERYKREFNEMWHAQFA